MGVVAFFHLPVPESLSDAEKKALYGTMHRKRSDVDNFCKSVMDSLFEEDGCIAFVQGFKLYVEEDGETRTDVFLLCQPTSKPAT